MHGPRRGKAGKTAGGARTTGQRGFVHVLLLILFLMGVTTWGVLETSTRSLEAQTRSKFATQAALDEGVKGIITYIKGVDMEPNRYGAIHRILPPLDYFNVENEDSLNDDRFIVTRPGQLPCPDTTGDGSDDFPIFSADIPAATPANISTRVSLSQIPAVRDNEDGNLDGLSDPGGDLCSSAEFEALGQGSRFGRLPTSEYFDYVNFNKGVGTGDILDGNFDRLWYGASRNLTDVSRPINPYQVNNSEDWIWVLYDSTLFTSYVVPDVAAVVISPGPPTDDQEDRLSESEIFAPGIFVSAEFSNSNEVDPTLYLEGDNPTITSFSATNAFLSYIDPDLASEDQMFHVTRHDVLQAIERDYTEELDAIVDSLEGYYDANAHLPSPATFEKEHADFITRRLARPSKPRWAEPASSSIYLEAAFIHSNLSPIRDADDVSEYAEILRPQTAASKSSTGATALQLQGGRIQYGVGKPINPGADVITYVNSSIDASELGRVLLPQSDLTLLNNNVISQQISGADVGYVYIDSDTSTPSRSGFGSSPGQPPFTDALYPSSTAFGSPAGGGGVWQAVIPAGTLLRTALPTYYAPHGIQQPNAIVASANFTGTLALAEVGGDHIYGSGFANVAFAGLDLGLLGNLSHYGYASILPAGTPIRTSVAVTIFGKDFKLDSGSGLPSRQFAHQIFRPANLDFEIGVCGDSTTPCDLRIPSYTPVATGTQGLLPAPLFPNQLPHATTITTFNDALAIRGTSYPFDTLGELRYVPLEDYHIGTTNIDIRTALFAGADGGIGSFPAEVTMHAPFSQLTTTITAPARTNQPYDSEFEPVVQPTMSVGGPVAAVKPFPIVGSSGEAITPSEIGFRGYITVPAGSKFFYPEGSRVLLGNQFMHSHDEFLFAGVGPTLSPFPRVNPMNLTISSPLRARAILAPGAVLQNVPVAASDILPNGLSVTAAATLDLVTLANGGVLEYAQLLHYDRGDVAIQPLNHAQAAFRIEASAIELINARTRGYLDESEFAPIIAATTRPLEGLPGSGRLADTNNDFSHIDGYHLYPFHAAYAPMSRRLLPLVQPLIAVATTTNTITTPSLTTTVTLTTSSVIATVGEGDSRLFNNVSRAEAFAFNLGQETSVANLTLTVAPAINRAALLTSTVASYFPVDEFGLGVEGMSNRNSSDLAISLTTTVMVGGTSLTLDFDQGVRMQANPGMMWLGTLTNTVDLGVEFKQYESPFAATPFVAPFAPDLKVSTQVSVSLGVSTFTVFTTDSAELALHLNSSTTIDYLSSGTSFNSDPSDRFLIGDSASQSQRLMFQFPTDTYVSDTGYSTVATTTVTSYTFVPAGARAEFGYLEARPDSRSCNSSQCMDSFVPGGRVFKDVGYYPLNPRRHALRSNRPIFSLPASSTIPLGLAYVGSASPAPTDVTLTIDGSTLTVTPSDSAAVFGDFQLHLPAGIDINAGSVDVSLSVSGSTTTTITRYVLDEDIDLLVGRGSTLSITAGSAPISSIVTDFSSAGGIFATPDGWALAFGPVTTGADLEELDFNFVSHGIGVITRDEANVDDNTIIGELHQNQAVRLRPAIDGYLRPLPSPGVLPMLELAWSGVDGEWNHTIFDPESLVFAQNHPLFYSVADNCLKGRIHVAIDCTEEDGSGLEVDVLPGERVRLPAETIAPGGLVIHSHPDFSQEINELLVSYGTTTATVNGVRLEGDGQLVLMERSSTDPLGNPILTDSATAVAAAAGSTVTITPPGNGVDFMVIAPGNTAATIYNLDSQAGLRGGHTDPIEVVAGGYTLDREAAASYRITVAGGSTLTLGAGSTIYTSTDPTYASVHLGAGSTSDGNDLSGYRMINAGLLSTVTLTASAPVPTEDFFTLPLLYPAGDTVTIGSAPPVGTENIMSLPAQTTISVTNDRGYKWQGFFSKAGANEVTLSSVYLRNYNYLTTSITITSPLASISITTGLAMPGDFAFNNTAGIFSTFTSFFVTATADVFTASFTPSKGQCLLCATLTLTFTPAGATLYTPFTLTIADNFEGTVALSRGGASQNFPANFYYHNIVTSSILTVDPSFATAVSPLLVTLRYTNPGTLATSDQPESFAVELGAASTYESWRGTFRENAITTRTTSPTFSLPFLDSFYSDSALNLNLVTLANQFGFVIDKSAAQQPWEIVTKKDALSVTGPYMIYTNSNIGPAYPFASSSFIDPLSAPFNATATTVLPAVRDASQIFAPASDNLLEIRAGAAADDLHYELHVPVPDITVNSSVVYAGSRIMPESGGGGEIHMARRFPETVAFTLTLGSNGAVGNIVGGSGMGRPGVFTKPQLFSLVSPSSASDVEDSNLKIYYLLDGSYVENSPPIAGAGFPTMFFHHPEEVLDELDMRQLDAVIYAASLNVNPGPINPLSLTTDLIQVPALHQISFAANAELTIYPHYSLHTSSLVANGDVEPFTFPANTTLEAIYPNKTQQDSLGTTSLAGTRLFRTLPATDLSVEVLYDGSSVATATILLEEEEFVTAGPTTLTATVSHSPVSLNIQITAYEGSLGTITSTITSSFTPGHPSWPRDTDHAAGLEDRPAANFTDFHQNLWIRIGNDRTLTFGGATVTLMADAVVNPFLGTYLNPVEVQSDLTDKIAMVMPQELIPEDDIVVSRPALTLPRGITLAFSPDVDARFTNVKAVLGYSPRPLGFYPGLCAQPPHSLSNQAWQSNPPFDANLKHAEWQVLVAANSTTYPPRADRLGHADICSLLDTSENTDFDDLFTYSTRESGSTFGVTDNDIMRIVGGKLKL